MSQVGDRAIFAIEWQVIWRDGWYIHGHFCVWASGERIGDYEDDELLSSTSSYLKEFLSFSHERNIHFLNGKSKEEIFAYVFDTGMISPHLGETLSDASKRREIPPHLQNNYRLHGRLRSIFHLTDIGEYSFGAVSIILFTDQATRVDRLIWRDNAHWRLFEAVLSIGYFEEIAQKFLMLYSKDVKDLV